MKVNAAMAEAEKDFSNVEVLATHALTLLWPTSGGMIGGSDPKVAAAAAPIRIFITENPLNKYGIFHQRPRSTYSPRYISKHVVDHFLCVLSGHNDCETSFQKNIPHIIMFILDHILNDQFCLLHNDAAVIEGRPPCNERTINMDFEIPGPVTFLCFNE
ncbi:hypothetical protein B0J11DRAFT_164514 [Dendryphion nanum]|uniref:Uncharacterized protein n=1 Tax=Dendryphion nanum TaxID=256645 RepID=A0A9P9EEE8_9PLEO|nr:hypothetical protein B0J11DRAFT_164514 [Dendryphion nanum]